MPTTDVKLKGLTDYVDENDDELHLYKKLE